MAGCTYVIIEILVFFSSFYLLISFNKSKELINSCELTIGRVVGLYIGEKR